MVGRDWIARIVAGRIESHQEEAERIELTRRCLAEVLAERVGRGELREEDARHIGTQVMRDNALALFPGLKKKLWKGKRRLLP